MKTACFSCGQNCAGAERCFAQANIYDSFSSQVVDINGNSTSTSCAVQTIPTAMKGAFFSCGQNCAGAERFFVQAAVYDSFVSQVADITNGMRQGHALGASPVDCGSMCMPGLAEKVAELVDDAVQRGARVSSCYVCTDCINVSWRLQCAMNA